MMQSTTEPLSWRRRTLRIRGVLGGRAGGRRRLMRLDARAVVAGNGIGIIGRFPVGKFRGVHNDIQDRHRTVFHRDGDDLVGDRRLSRRPSPDKWTGVHSDEVYFATPHMASWPGPLPPYLAPCCWPRRHLRWSAGRFRSNAGRGQCRAIVHRWTVTSIRCCGPIPRRPRPTRRTRAANWFACLPPASTTATTSRLRSRLCRQGGVRPHGLPQPEAEKRVTEVTNRSSPISTRRAKTPPSLRLADGVADHRRVLGVAAATEGGGLRDGPGATRHSAPEPVRSDPTKTERKHMPIFFGSLESRFR